MKRLLVWIVRLASKWMPRCFAALGVLQVQHGLQPHSQLGLTFRPRVNHQQELLRSFRSTTVPEALSPGCCLRVGLPNLVISETQSHFNIEMGSPCALATASTFASA